jgi:membrane protease YdiL (CAAX protease family)
MTSKTPPNHPTGQKPVFTQLATILIVLTVLVMGYLYLAHKDIPADAAWVQYTLMMAGFALLGYFGTQLLAGFPSGFAPLDLNTGVRAAMVFAAAMVTQLVIRVAFTFSTTEQALYFVFAAVAEEVFFRVFLLSLLIKLGRDQSESTSRSQRDLKRIKMSPPRDLIVISIAIVIQAAIFTAIHQNYYGNLPMLASVFVGGIILGIFFVIWKDPTANILGHFLLNIIAVQNLFVVL